MRTSEIIDAEIKQWYDVLQEIYKKENILEPVKPYLQAAAKQINESKNGLENISKEDIISSIKTLPINKISNDNIDIIKQSQASIASKAFLPLVTLLFGIKNFYICWKELSKILSGIDFSGLEPKHILYPEYISSRLEEEKNNPEEIKKIILFNKSARSFMDDFISLFSNITDFIIDLIFIIPSIATLGAASSINIGISLLIASIELISEGAVLSKYDAVNKKAYSICIKEINKLTVEKASLYEEESELDKLINSKFLD